MDLVCEVTKKVGDEVLSHFVVYTSKGYYWEALYGKGYGEMPKKEDGTTDEEGIKRIRNMPEEEKTKKFAELGKKKKIYDLMNVDHILAAYRKDGWSIRWDVE